MKLSPHDLRVIDLESFIKEVERRCKENSVSFKRDQLPGSKRDFIHALRKSVDSFTKVGEGSIESALKDVNCKFLNGGRICAQDKTIRTIFSELF